MVNFNYLAKYFKNCKFLSFFGELQRNFFMTFFNFLWLFYDFYDSNYFLWLFMTFYDFYDWYTPCNTECLEIIQRKFLKYSLKLKSSTPTAMIYCETGYLSIETELKVITIYITDVKQLYIPRKLEIFCEHDRREGSLRFENFRGM